MSLFRSGFCLLTFPIVDLNMYIVDAMILIAVMTNQTFHCNF